MHGALFANGGAEQLLSLRGPGQPVFANLDEFRKAVEGASYATDTATLSGGAALRRQSLEPDLIRTTQTDDGFILYNLLSQTKATSMVDEYTTKPRVGGFPGSGVNTETGVIPAAQGQYEREVDFVKMFMTRREVFAVGTYQDNIIDPIADQKMDGILELKTAFEFYSWYGDKDVWPLGFDSLPKKIRATGDTDLIVDANGEGLGFVAPEIIQLATKIGQKERWGKATDVFCSLDVQAEIDRNLDPAFRINANGSQSNVVGTPVKAISTSRGELRMRSNQHIIEGQAPFETIWPDAANKCLAPTSVVGTPTSGTAANKFQAKHAGLYYYAVEAICKDGRSLVTKSAQVSVGQGDKVTLVITHPVDTTITGFMIHRSKRNGVNTTAEFREMVAVPRQVGATTTYVDENQKVPGTSQLTLASIEAGRKAVDYRRLIPMTLFPLYPTDKAVHVWAQIAALYLRVAKPRQHAFIDNILPAGALWRPF